MAHRHAKSDRRRAKSYPSTRQTWPSTCQKLPVDVPNVTGRRACQNWRWRCKGLYCEGPFISPGFVLACRRARFPIREALTRHKDQTEAEKTCTHTQSNIKQQKVGRKQCRQQNTCFCFLFGGGGGAPLRPLRWSMHLPQKHILKPNSSATIRLN